MTLPIPPRAARHPHTVTAPHGAQRQDPYYWLRDDARAAVDVLAYLHAENTYADALLANSKDVQDALYDETVARIQQDDASVPFRERGYWYYARFETGKDYPIHARRKDAPGVDAASILAANAAADFVGEDILLDVNALAAGKDYYSVGAYAVSQDNAVLAYADDSNGRRQYTLRFRAMDGTRTFSETIEGASSDLVWADDNKTLFYIENDAETLLTVRVKKHVIGTDPKDDPVVYEETDDSFYMGIERSRDDNFILIRLSSTVSDELRYASARDPRDFKVLAARARDVEYDADHFGGRWVIRTNADGAQNFKVVTANDDATERTHWHTRVTHRSDVLIEDVALFEGFTAIAERSGGLERLRILKPDGSSQYVAADEPAYSMGLEVNSEPASPWLRYSYTSMTTPATTYALNVVTGERRLLKRQPVLGGYDPAHYVTERRWATARDGSQVPVSIVYKKGFEKNGTAALLQYAYGSYGLSMDPGFSVAVISLLNRGMAYAIAHVRGGQEMGRAWYDDGKLLHKQNTFTDFIDVTDFLVQQGYAAPHRVAAHGGSAGGLLMGAIANMAPEKYRVILSQVPFVDVVTTMLDPSIPLTTNEYDEWGNPEDPIYYDYILRYSPYDNLAAQAYPAMFVGTGLWDSQVQYWEPAKYVARLRMLNTSAAPVVFRTNMEAGHGGKSGRFRRYREQAEMYAFMLEQLGVPQ